MAESAMVVAVAEQWPVAAMTMMVALAAVVFLHSGMGLDLGLEPRWYLGLVILVGTGALALLLFLVLGYSQAATCVGACKQQRNPPHKQEDVAQVVVFFKLLEVWGLLG